MKTTAFDEKYAGGKNVTLENKGWGDRMKRMGTVPKLLPLLLALQCGTALAFDTIKFDDGTTLDMSLQVNYTNMKRLKDPVTINRMDTRPSEPGAIAVTPGILRVNPQGKVVGTLWPSAVDQFTQWETRMNTDDGNNSVAKHGTISNRISALMDFNLTKDNYRAFVRVNAFRDQKIFDPGASISPGTYNLNGSPRNHSQTAEDLAGQRIRLLDAYVQGRWKLGEGGKYPLFIRYGRQIVNWGEGLLFQGIGSSMNANDQIKGQTPGIPAAEAFLPAEQIYGTLGVTDKLTLMAYKKFKFVSTEQAPVGTYWSTDDISGPGGFYQNAFEWKAWNSFLGPMLGPMFPGVEISNYGAYRLPDIGANNRNQWGLGLKYQWSDKLDLGLYHLRYTESVGMPEFRFGTTYYRLGKGYVSGVGPNNPASSSLNPGGYPYDINAELLMSLNYLTPYPNSYALRFMNNVKLTGASFSTVFGDWQVAGETAYRSGAPIAMGDHHYNLAKGRTISVNASALRAWAGTQFLGGVTRAETATLALEMAVQHLLGYDQPYYNPNPALTPAVFGPLMSTLWGPTPLLSDVRRIPTSLMFDKTGVATGARLELSYTPWPEWSLDIPIFYWRELVGAGPSAGSWNSGLTGKNSGRVSAETKFTYKQNLSVGMTYTHYLGEVDMRFHNFNPFADRDFVSLNAGYHF